MGGEARPTEKKKNAKRKKKENVAPTRGGFRFSRRGP